MRERIQTAIENRVLDVLPEGKTIDRHQLQAARIPPGVRHFLLKTLDRRSELEAAELLDVRSQWLDATDEQFIHSLQEAVHRLRETARFPVQEWPRAMRQAVDEILEYLMAPVPALLGFVFREGEDSVTAQDLRRRAGFFSDYAYIGRAIDAYLDRKQDQRIFRSDFSKTLSHLDRKLTHGRSASEWVSLISPLERLVRFGDAEMNGIPVPFVLRFLEEKDLQDEAELLRRWSGSSRSTILTLATFKTLFEEAPTQATPSLFEPPSATSPPEQEVPSRIPTQEPAPQTDPRPSPVTGPPAPETVPLWKRFQTMVSPAAESPKAPSEAEPLWKTFQKENAPTRTTSKTASSVEKPLPPSPEKTSHQHDAADLDAVETLVLGAAAARRRMFIRELFRNDEAQYERVVRQLSQAQDWSSASRMLANEVFRSNKVDIYSEPAVAFTNAVENRFRVTP